jgi:myo-inositol-1(or 4)-monophosphatase
MDSNLSFITQLARETGELLSEHFKKSETSVNLKADFSVVTEADLAADQLITQAIKKEFPGDAVLSEELQTTFSANGSAVWIVDPLDGTTNFSLGIPFWGVSIARVVNDIPTSAALYFPIIDELYAAERGSGATLNGDPINVKPFRSGQPAAFFSCCTRTYREYEVKVPYKTRILGSAAYSLCAVGRGSAVLAFEATPKIWDLAGAWLVVLEAGGVVELHDGTPLFPLVDGTDYSQINYPTIAAPSAESASRAREQIRPKT